MRADSRCYIVLLNWNGWGDTVACLESLLPDIMKGARVIVCDNASGDGSLDHIEAWAAGRVDALRPQNPRLARLMSHGRTRPRTQRLDRRAAEAGRADANAQLFLIDNEANLGFAAGNNVGLRFALAQADMESVWLLNNDTIVEAGCLDAMRRRIRIQGAPAVCGSVIHFFHDPQRIQCLGGNRFDHRRGLAGESEGRHLHEDALPGEAEMEAALSYLSGCSLLLGRSFLEDVGLLNEDYFLYYEEIDWFTRAAGRYRLLVARDAHLYHREGSSIGSRSWRRGPSLTSDRYMFESRLRFMARYHPQWLWRCRLHNWLDVAKRLLKGQWRNALVIARANLKPVAVA